MAPTSVSRLLARALLKLAFTFENASSMGFRSGEYGGRNNSWHPLASRSWRTFFPLCADRLSITTDWPSFSMGAKACSTYASKTSAVVVPSTATPGPMSSADILANSVVFFAVARYLRVRLPATRRPGIERRQRGVGAALFDEHQPPNVECRSDYRPP